MREFERKRKIRKRIYSKFTILILLALLVLLLSSTFNIYQKADQSKIQLELAAARLAKLEKQHDSLEYKIEALESTVGIEEQIRNKFYLAKDGEHAVFIIDEEPEEEPAPEPTGLRVFWQKTTNFFGF